MSVKAKNLVPTLLCAALASVGCERATKGQRVAEIRVDLGKGVFIEMVHVSRGAFRMGDAEPYGKRNLRWVEITKEFAIGKYEVTQQQYEHVMGVNPSVHRGPQNAVDTVNYHEAVEFCKRLTKMTGRNFRLPREAEWEYACRAGSTTKYCFGDDAKKLRDYGWAISDTRWPNPPVGQKLPNSWRIHDMHGNVWEWCADLYTGPVRGVYDDTYADNAVMRGGSWMDDPNACDSTVRFGYPFYVRDDDQGFRVACDVSAE